LLNPDNVALEVREGLIGDGYAVATPEAREAVALAEADNLHLETTYAGKALAAWLADARADRLAGRTALFWNTHDSR